MKAKRENCWLCLGIGAALLCLCIGNALYRVSSRNGVPMFSYEAFVLGKLYWIGIGAGIVLYAIYSLGKAKGGDGDA